MINASPLILYSRIGKLDVFERLAPGLGAIKSPAAVTTVPGQGGKLKSMEISNRPTAVVDLPEPSGKSEATSPKKTAYRLIEKALADIGGDELLEALQSRLPQDFEYAPADRSDEDVLYEALREKYGL